MLSLETVDDGLEHHLGSRVSSDPQLLLSNLSRCDIPCLPAALHFPKGLGVAPTTRS